MCLLCYGFHRNEICKDVMLQAVTLSLVPARFVDVREWDVSLLGKLTGWFKGHFSIDPHLPGNTNHLVSNNTANNIYLTLGQTHSPPVVTRQEHS